MEHTFATPYYSPILFAGICLTWAFVCGSFGAFKIFFGYDSFQDQSGES